VTLWSLSDRLHLIEDRCRLDQRLVGRMLVA
jgi:hypothetical protein